MDCCVAFLGDQSLQYVQLSFWRTHAFNAAARIAVGDVIHTTRCARIMCLVLKEKVACV